MVRSCLKRAAAAVGIRSDALKQLGGRASIGEGSRLLHARVTAPDPTDCRLAVGPMSNIECSICLERPGAIVTIGARTHLGGRTLLDAACEITVGDDVLVAFDVLIADHDSHSLVFSERQNDVADWMQGHKDWSCVKMAPVKICDKAWIGARAIILKGVTIGEGAVVGAGSVVTGDIPAWCVAAGNPARVIRQAPESSP